MRPGDTPTRTRPRSPRSSSSAPRRPTPRRRRPGTTRGHRASVAAPPAPDGPHDRGPDDPDEPARSASPVDVAARPARRRAGSSPRWPCSTAAISRCRPVGARGASRSRACRWAGSPSPTPSRRCARRSSRAPRSPVPVTVGDATRTVDPRTAGLAVDWAATVASAEHQPLNPVTRDRVVLHHPRDRRRHEVGPRRAGGRAHRAEARVRQARRRGQRPLRGHHPAARPARCRTGARRARRGGGVDPRLGVRHAGRAAAPPDRAHHDGERRHRRPGRRSPSPPWPAPITITGENDTSATLTPAGHRRRAHLPRRPGGRPRARAQPGRHHQGAPAAARRLGDPRPRRHARLHRHHPGRRPVAGRPRRRLPRHREGAPPGAHRARAAPTGRGLRRTAREAHHRGPVQAGHLRRSSASSPRAGSPRTPA